MFDAYRRVLKVPGAIGFTMAGLLLRLPLAVYPVGVVLLVALGTGDYAGGGLLTLDVQHRASSNRNLLDRVESSSLGSGRPQHEEAP